MCLSGKGPTEVSIRARKRKLRSEGARELAN
jgi:hypothetical protein